MSKLVQTFPIIIIFFEKSIFRFKQNKSYLEKKSKERFKFLIILGKVWTGLDRLGLFFFKLRSMSAKALFMFEMLSSLELEQYRHAPN